MEHPLETYRKIHDLTLGELGKLIDVDKGNLSRIINTGSAMRNDLCQRIFKATGIEIVPNKRVFTMNKKENKMLDKVVDKMFKEDPNPVMANWIPEFKPNMYLVPIKAWGGFLAGYEKQEFDLEKIPFPLVKGECFAFEIDGYSMLSEYKPNDYFVGSKVEGFNWLVKDRDFVFQTVNGLILKRFDKIEDNRCFIKSLNDEYNPVDPIPLKEIKAVYQKEGVWIK